jgi:hypothetical protein
MPNTHLTIPSTTRLGGQAQSAIDQAAQVRNAFESLYGVMAAFGGDYAAMAVVIGFTGDTAATQAQTLWGLVSGARTSGTNHANLLALINNCG